MLLSLKLSYNTQVHVHIHNTGGRKPILLVTIWARRGFCSKTGSLKSLPKPKTTSTLASMVMMLMRLATTMMMIRCVVVLCSGLFHQVVELTTLAFGTVAAAAVDDVDVGATIYINFEKRNSTRKECIHIHILLLMFGP